MILRDLYTFKAPNRILTLAEIENEHQRKLAAARKFFYMLIILNEGDGFTYIHVLQLPKPFY